ncbi:MAG: hypothetical protein GY821_03355 [Gammaproteobacteria bacterium]|nr:hypothetical protein [Gammaproteobacteria bacterium]
MGRTRLGGGRGLGGMDAIGREECVNGTEAVGREGRSVLRRKEERGRWLV